jgi:hypothetical protein
MLANNNIDRNAISLNGIEATGNIGITLNNTTIRIIWTNSTIAPFLGWTQASANTGPGQTGFTYISPNRANFNSLQSILVHCDKVSGSYLSGRGNGDIIASISPNVRPGSLINYQPINLISNNMNSRHISQMTFYLTDQNNGQISTGGENFDMLLQIDLIPE